MGREKGTLNVRTQKRIEKAKENLYNDKGELRILPELCKIIGEVTNPETTFDGMRKLLTKEAKKGGGLQYSKSRVFAESMGFVPYSDYSYSTSKIQDIAKYFTELIHSGKAPVKSEPVPEKPKPLADKPKLKLITEEPKKSAPVEKFGGGKKHKEKAPKSQKQKASPSIVDLILEVDKLREKLTSLEKRVEELESRPDPRGEKVENLDDLEEPVPESLSKDTPKDQISYLRQKYYLGEVIETEEDILKFTEYLRNSRGKSNIIELIADAFALPVEFVEEDFKDYTDDDIIYIMVEQG